MTPTLRRAARAVVRSPDGCVLLLAFAFPWRDTDLWITPGGALDDGEDARTALRRELHEETGLRVDALGPELWHREHAFTYRDQPILQRERYFLVDTDRFEPRPHALDPGDETDWFRGFRWWPIDDLPDEADHFAPTGLGAHLRDLARDGAPIEPFRISV